MVSVLAHIYYNASVKEFSENIGRLRQFVDKVYMNLVRENFSEFESLDFSGDHILTASPNKGKDIGGKLVLLARYLTEGQPSPYVLLLHDKKSPQSPMSGFWSKNLFRIIDPTLVPQVFRLFEENEDAGIVASSIYIRNEWNDRLKEFDSPNNFILKNLINEYCITLTDYRYVAGTMFWARSALFENFFAQYDPLNIVKTLETGNVMDTEEGSLTHSWERMLSWICTSQNKKIYGI